MMSFGQKKTKQTSINIILVKPGSSSSSITATPMTDFWFPAARLPSLELKKRKGKKKICINTILNSHISKISDFCIPFSLAQVEPVFFFFSLLVNVPAEPKVTDVSSVGSPWLLPEWKRKNRTVKYLRFKLRTVPMMLFVEQHMYLIYTLKHVLFLILLLTILLLSTFGFLFSQADMF